MECEVAVAPVPGRPRGNQPAEHRPGIRVVDHAVQALPACGARPAAGTGRAQLSGGSSKPPQTLAQRISRAKRALQGRRLDQPGDSPSCCACSTDTREIDEGVRVLQSALAVQRPGCPRAGSRAM